ncbi:MAG: RluA family pseudouridine synthase [Deltaproteobacteria bacterium]|nr:RluA family pseudouridine synthase [Deltaproteobacteria bacterium]
MAHHVFVVSSTAAGQRLDAYLSAVMADLTRSRVKHLIEEGHVLINGSSPKPSTLVKPNDCVALSIPPPQPSQTQPEDIPLEVLFEDDHLIVINKPPGLVVHPAAGHSSGTLVHALLFHCRSLSGIGGVERPGIVHRLDKDTSGVMVVAKTDLAHVELSRQFKEGEVSKTYLALVYGTLPQVEGSIDRPIGRHPYKRKQMACVESGGRTAMTLWRVKEIFPAGLTLLSVNLRTGRTHQIRVHLSEIGHPVVGDPVYGPKKLAARLPEGHLKQAVKVLERQMLHSCRLQLTHPVTHQVLAFQAAPPHDMADVLNLAGDTQNQA